MENKMTAKMAIVESLKTLSGIDSIAKGDKYYFIQYKSGEQARLNILNSHVFKYYMSPTGEFLDYPEPHDPSHEAKINEKEISDYDTKYFQDSELKENEASFTISTEKLLIKIDKQNTTMSVIDKRTMKEVIKEIEALSYDSRKTTQKLLQNNDEFYFGGGMQNGRFTHKGEAIEIVNTNNWLDGGVASPCPFYWSSYGYGVLRNTWQPGVYDFCLTKSVSTVHEEKRFDAFFFINPQPKDILNDYFELTGQPILMPEYAFYEAHLNAFNRDYWVKVDECTSGAILFEDGYYYKSYQPNQIGDRDGILESLNGEKDNYQFSARAMVDRYKRHDMPLGWFVPNDGYGSGYGQTDSLDGDIRNLTEFAHYARLHGVEVGLWTESNLHPCDPENPQKGDRDLSKEVGTAGVVALKADVAWIGEGYSFGLSAIEDASDTFSKVTKHGVRPMVIMVDGWAGTQRCAGIWSGDQMGGEWEYIRFHIPTYIGTGLSGQPNIGSDMDGIYGGKNKKVNVRDYQWKTFTPMQLNMDGWGYIPKTPFTFDKEACNINRAYLKLKSMLMPYTYTIAHESIHGLPMIRAMFLEFPNESPAFTTDSQYQFMWGSNLLVAPIYNDDEDIHGNSVRNGIYLPDTNQVWIGLFTGKKFQGGRIYNDVEVPLWELPVFVKDGAIIPVTNPNNNPYEIKRDKRIFNLYPNGESNFDLYEDDGKSTDYLDGNFAVTSISARAPKSNQLGDLEIIVGETKGAYKTMVIQRTTEIHIMSSKDVEKIKVSINGDSVELDKVHTKNDYDNNEDVYYFDDNFVINPYLKDIAKEIIQKFLLIKIRKEDVTKSNIHMKITKFVNTDNIFGSKTIVKDNLNIPTQLTVFEDKTTHTSITLIWEPVKDIKCYEIERDGVQFSNIKSNIATFNGFKSETDHAFRIRSMTDDGVSEWSDYIIGTTKEDPIKYTVKDIKVTCSLPCQPKQEIGNLIAGDCNSMWHTHWGQKGKFNLPNKPLKLHFDFDDIHAIDRVEYHPRSDGGNGNFLKIKYRISEDGLKWTNLSGEVDWEPNPATKTIYFNGAKFRFMEMIVSESIGNFGSGKKMLFFKKIN